jgi:putative tricarboxylic transport membrane protein
LNTLQPRLSKSLPYIVILAIVGYLYYVANHIEFAAPGGRIGPDFWPKAILVMAMVTCVYEIAKNLLSGGNEREVGGVLQTIYEETPDLPEEGAGPQQKLYPWRLLVGVILTLAYAFTIETLGFFLCTMLYLAAFMVIGRYYRYGVIAASSVLGSLIFMFVFMKIVYVSLPLGTGPFAEVSFFLMRVMGIK